jgi:lipopolysaccharide export system permease protein
MRRLDKLILQAFFGPFFLTTLVATFILLIQYMLKYFDDFVGKNLGIGVFAELLFYFALNMLQVALPLGVLVSSLMTFGNLGEHFELTAIKSAGISLLRAMRPIFVFVVMLSIAAFYFNNYVVPAANLKAYSLLYDIKHKKPALDIKAGVFYDGIPNYSIKAADKLPDNKTLLDVMIYDHTKRDGNKRVILADSSLMYTIYNEKYLKLELFNGTYFNEVDKAGNTVSDFYRTNFDRLEIVFSLSSFDLKRTKEELFRNNRQMKNIAELTKDIDSLQIQQVKQKTNLALGSSTYLNMHSTRYLEPIEEEQAEEDSVATEDENQAVDQSVVENSDQPQVLYAAVYPPQEKNKRSVLPRSKIRTLDTSVLKLDKKAFKTTLDTAKLKVKAKLSIEDLDSLSPIERRKLEQAELKILKKEEKEVRPLAEWTLNDLDSTFVQDRQKQIIVQNATNKARNFKVNITGIRIKSKSLESRIDSYTVEKYKKYSQAFACIVMFLIGAPLGAIIKKGGLGVPVIVSIFFFIIYYVLTISSEKWAKANVIEGELAVWTADLDVIAFRTVSFCVRQESMPGYLIRMSI